MNFSRVLFGAMALLFLFLVAPWWEVHPQVPGQQKQSPNSSQQPSPPRAQPAQGQKQPAQAQPKELPKGKLQARGELLSFSHWGEGTLRLTGHGVILLSDVEGKIENQGFRELKELPGGKVPFETIRLKPSYAARVRLFQGRGTLVVEGRYGSVRGNLQKSRLEFIGRGSITLWGQGTFKTNRRDGKLYGSNGTSLFIPE